MTAENTAFALSEHWREFGIPSYAQFDNSTVFTSSRHPDSIGQVIRFCLSLGVILLFAPPCETGFQASIERYNGHWQQSIWNHFFCFKNFWELVEHSETYVKAHREKNWDFIEATNNRYDISVQKRQLSNKPLQGTIIFIRRTDNKG
ncbi:MAG: hypothetical protein LBU34_05615, partial [Planctomycetaceae bacterium]|nr:hypothetical protein [Planctomycetaceae bacterium]